MGKLNNTKDRILQEASILLGEKGYELVSMREISNAVGIKVSSLYNHYKSKQDILDNIINYFSENFDKYQPNIEDVEKLLQNYTPEEILRKSVYIFNENDNPIMQNMLRLLFMEQYHNKDIRDMLFKYMIYNPADNLDKVLKKLIELKVVAPCDSKTLSNMLIRSLVINSMEYTHGMDIEKTYSEFVSYWDLFIRTVLGKSSSLVDTIYTRKDESVI